MTRAWTSWPGSSPARNAGTRRSGTGWRANCWRWPVGRSGRERYQQALAVARAQSAKAFELRAATSLARLWQAEGRRAEAHALLAPVCAWFTEGLDTADLKDATSLLNELQ